MKAKSQFLLLLMLGTIIFCQDTSENSITQQKICDRKCSDDVQCLKDCSARIKYGHRKANVDATLFCRAVTRLILRSNFGTFDIERRTQNGNWSDAFRGYGNGFIINALEPGTRYQFRFHRVYEDEVTQPEITGWYETMSNAYKPSKVTDIVLLSYDFDEEDPMHIVSTITFTPAKDRSCFHEATYRNATGFRIEAIYPEIEQSIPIVKFENWEFVTTYTVSITATNGIAIKSDEAVMNFTTPSCLNMLGNLTICVPDEVEGLNATTTRKEKNIFDINVTWAMPKFIPDRYDIWLCPNITDNEYIIRQNASGTFTEIIFPDVEIVKEFRVYIRAESPRGAGSETFKDFTIPEIITEATELGNFIPKYLISTILVGIGIGIGIAIYGYFRIRKRRLSQVDEYEVSPKRLLTTRVLGTGAFGIVRLGTLRDDRGNLTKVAVKRLREDSTVNDLRSFLHEIKMMKALDKHQNIVSLLGCCTIGPFPFLIVEYCSRGDLHSFLRKSLVEAMSPLDKAKKCTVTSETLPQSEKVPKQNCDMLLMSPIDDDYVQVYSSAEDQDTNCDPVIVTVMDMLNFGRQIATGMEFLSWNRIVHRDLATRNVLVCYDRTVKISDFGMSQDIYQENFYKKLGNGRMPVKWMAIEALAHQLYSTYSDVWSFGILLWEIVTLGGDPYPGVPTMDLLERLQSGYRMERPEDCSIPLYDVMLSCWKTRPKDRPNFSILRQELDKLISVTTGNEYLDLNEVPEGRITLS